MGCFGLDPDNEIPYEKELDSGFSGTVGKRRPTDKHFLILFVLCIGILGGLTIYCGINANFARLFNGFDDCGNVCGETNTKEADPDFACKGEDMTNKKFLLLDTSSIPFKRRCVADCMLEPEYTIGAGVHLKQCIYQSPKKTSPESQQWFKEMMQVLDETKGDIVKLSLFAMVLSLIFVFLLRSVPGLMVWGLLLGFCSLLFIATTTLWFKYNSKSNREDNDLSLEAMKGKDAMDLPPYPEVKEEDATDSIFYAAIFMTTITIFSYIIILVVAKHISLVVHLFKEAGKAIQDMPVLLVQPIVTLVAIILVLVGYIYINVVYVAAGFLTRVTSDPGNGVNTVDYSQDSIMQFAYLFAFFMCLWLIQFCIGCQHMIIAGSAASWFFTRDKNQLRSPIKTATKNLFSYHLGSVAIGSLLITIIQIIRLIVKCIKRSRLAGLRLVFACLLLRLHVVQKLLSYWTKNAYVQVAMFGVGFCDGGARAFKLLTSNALAVVTINSVAGFVLFLGKALVVGITLLMASILNDRIFGELWPALLLSLIAFAIVDCFLAVYEMVIDTIFLCFCEDCEMNDGDSKPYFMSQGLMQYVENSNKLKPRKVESK